MRPNSENPAFPCRFVILKMRPTFSRAGHVCALVGIAPDGVESVYDVTAFYGPDGRKTRGDAVAFGRETVARQGRNIKRHLSRYIPRGTIGAETLPRGAV